MTTYTGDIYGQLRRIADGATAPDTYTNDVYGQIKRIADWVGSPSAYSGDKYSQLRRIADAIGAAGTYTGDIYGQVRRIADAGAASGSGDIYSQLVRIANNGIGASIQLSANTQAENTTIGTAIGTLSVVGGSGTYVFSKTVDVDSAFTLTVATLKNAIAYDYETATFHLVTIAADNSVDTPITRVFRVEVTNVNEAPVITSNGGGASASITINENTTAVTTVTATDVDASASLAYSISGGTDAASFRIGSTSGVLAFRVPPDFEIPTDSNTDNAYVVIVQVSDGALTDTQTITVTVANVAD